MNYSESDQAFLNLVIIDLYDEEVARHPEGISPAEVKAIIFPKVRELIRRTEWRHG